ncbi:DEAD/DEAH box helicase [Xanthomonas campestris]|uniref:DEAD/DEAH box helicase n=1 Tax=Xanthomonas campestris TaxID=339 RepID=UPI003891093C
MTLALKTYQTRSLNRLSLFFKAARLDGPADAFAASVDDGLIDTYKPMPGLPEVPYVCLRIPTGGGKTVMGAHVINTAGTDYLERKLPVVMWMVPTTQIKTQTLDAFRNPRHPYRQELDKAFGGQVVVFDVADFAQIRPADLLTKCCIVVATVAALRVEKTEGRKVYDHHEDLEPHFVGGVADLPYLERNDKGKVVASFANLLKLHGPLVVMDEAHNATTPLSYEVYVRLGPRAVVEMTATPDMKSSNVLVSVSAFELKAENMIKFPVVLKEHESDWPVAISSAVARRKALSKIATNEPDYIRPILLIQAESAKGVATVEEVLKHLEEVEKLPNDSVAVATGDHRGIEGKDLFAKDCPIEVIVTKQALKEGWDCSFAYVFCSVAQVKSDKDIQQLLGRVLRMPYATRRKQDEMNKAYAHVTTTSFGKAAGELTQSLVNIGFNPLEAAAAIRGSKTDGGPLELTGGSMNTPTLPVTRIELEKAPDLSSAPERDHERVVFKLTQEGDGNSGVVELTNDLDDSTVAAILKSVPAKRREEVAAQVERHQMLTAAAKAPSEHGIPFRVPRLYTVEQGELELVDRSVVTQGLKWNLGDYPADLSSFHFDNDSMTFEVDLEKGSVVYHSIKDDVGTYLPGFAENKTANDLIGFLDGKIRDIHIRQPEVREWVRVAIEGLMNDRGFSLAQLLRGQFVLQRKFSELLQSTKAAVLAKGFQQALFESGMELVVDDGPDHAFEYPADMTKYPARFSYQGPYRFSKHYYPVPGDLTWKTTKGEGEEYECAKAIDLLPEVEFWVRNLAHPSQFWMPTSRQRTYPDFVARLKDQRLLVVEYKGSDRFTADQEKEKRMVGDLWAAKSKGKGVYIMAVKEQHGPSVTDQIKAAINKKS